MSKQVTEVRISDHSSQVLAEFAKNLTAGLKAIGFTAEKHAKEECPVDTGRLRNSITFAITDYQSPANTSPGAKADPDEYKEKASPEKSTVYIGTNVEYAPAVEYRDIQHKTGKAHFIKNAAANHGDEYKAVMKAALKS